MYTLQIDNLHKRYGTHEVLKGVSLTAKAGDVTSIIGSSGSGKSTFLRCLNLLEQPHAGKILLNNEELRLVSAKDGSLRAADAKQLQRMRSRLAMVFQHFNLWSHMTVLENITMAPRRVLGCSKQEAEDRARRYLDKVGLPARVADQYPAFLSGGQQQRVAIARALATQPRFILLDEPFAGIDPIAVIEIQRIIGFLKARGIGVLITDHNVRETLGICDHAFIISDGQVLAQGTPSEIVDNAEVRRVYLGEHFRM